jgi:excisionase family DNA binding protein
MDPLPPTTASVDANDSRQGSPAPHFANSAEEARTAPGWLTVAKFALHTGLSLSTVRRLIKSGSLPFAQPGGRGNRLLIPANALSHARGDVGASQAGPASIVPTTVTQPAPAAKRAGPKPRWQQR